MGPQTVAAGFALLIATGLLIYFFVTASGAADTASNWFYLVFYVLMAWTAVEVQRFYVEDVTGMWLLTTVVLVDMALLFGATLLIVFKRVEFNAVAVVVTGGFLVLMLWMFFVSVIAISKGGLPEALGWLGVAVLVAAVAVVLVSSRDREVMLGNKAPSMALSVVYGAIGVGMTAWIIWLGAAPLSPL